MGGGAFGKHEREGRCVEGLVENVKESDNLEDSDIDDT
jgi:hypothetical protein